MPGRCLAHGVLLAVVFVAGGSAFPIFGAKQVATTSPATEGFGESELKAFSALSPIDGHTHIYAYAPAYIALLKKLHMHTLDIMVVSDNAEFERKDLAGETRDVFDIVHRSDHSVYACTTFDAYRFNGPNFSADAIAGINRAFTQGAVAVKLWKNFGMEVKDSQGHYVLPDNPALTPIYRAIAAKHKTLLIHIADPDTAWLPPNPHAVDGNYYLQHPEWYMYRIPGAPSKERILEARDHVIEANPNLRIVGAHLGSMEGDFDRIGRDLDKYPNFAVDLTARMPYLMLLTRAQAIAFFTKYQDRIIYGTDDSFYPDQDAARFTREAETTYARDWRFLSTDASFTFRGIQTQGLALPERILRKIYHDNAIRWYPDLKKAQ